MTILILYSMGSSDHHMVNFLDIFFLRQTEIIWKKDKFFLVDLEKNFFGKAFQGFSYHVTCNENDK